MPVTVGNFVQIISMQSERADVTLSGSGWCLVTSYSGQISRIWIR